MSSGRKRVSITFTEHVFDEVRNSLKCTKQSSDYAALMVLICFCCLRNSKVEMLIKGCSKGSEKNARKKSGGI